MSSTAPPRDQSELIEFLARMPLFADIPPEELTPLVAVVQRRRYPRGAVLFTQGQLGNVAFIVRDGLVDIMVASVDGRDLQLYEVRPGDYFGEMALLEGRPRSASAVCREASEVLALQRNDLLAALQRHPSIMLRMLQAMSRRLRQADRRLESLAFHDAALRLAEALWEASEEDAGGRLARLGQDTLAARIGVSRQTVNKLLGEWRRDGLVSIGRGAIRLPDPSRFAHWRDDLEETLSDAK